MYKSVKLRGHLIISMQKDVSKIHNIKIVNDKKNFKSSRGENSNLQGNPNQAIHRFLSRISTGQERWRVWKDILKILKDKICQPRTLYSAKLPVRYEGDIKAFLNKQRLKEFTATRSTLQEMLKGDFLPETKRQKYTKL